MKNYNSHGEPLDGTGDIKATPFDAHEQATRGEHVPTEIDSPDPDLSKIREFPKAVAHDEVTGEPVIAKNAKHEAQLKAAAEE